MADKLENGTPEPQSPPSEATSKDPVGPILGDDASSDPVLEQAAADLEELELPNMFWGSLIMYFGPGIILMMTGIGTSRRSFRVHTALVYPHRLCLQILRF